MAQLPCAKTFSLSTHLCNNPNSEPAVSHTTMKDSPQGVRVIRKTREAHSLPYAFLAPTASAKS